MTTLNKLEAELLLLQDTIDRVKTYIKDPINGGSSHSLVVGELNTYDLCG